ncbi:MAG: Hpt domain-containing protein [Flavobacteriaceae bacterium]
MGSNYNLDNVKELASGDADFVVAIAAAFLDEVPEAVSQIQIGIQNSDYAAVYQNAHKIKPTIQLFEIPVFEDVLVVQDWGKFEQSDKNINAEFERIDAVIQQVSTELRAKFDL